MKNLVMKLGSIAFTAGMAGTGSTVAVYEATKGNSNFATIAGCLGAYMAFQCYLNARGLNGENKKETQREEVVRE